MKIAVIGTGYVGLVTATCLAESGNDVVGIDKDAAKIATLKAGDLPIYEPGLLELVQRNCREQRLRFTTDLGSAVQDAKFIFVAVGTPETETGEADLSAVWAVGDHLVPTHTDGADRNDDKYIDNSKTYHQVNKDTSIGVEFAGNYPDVTKPATQAQIDAWKVLVKVLRARYDIPLDHVYAHNWIDYKDKRYCEGCALATLAREWGD